MLNIVFLMQIAIIMVQNEHSECLKYRHVFGGRYLVPIRYSMLLYKNTKLYFISILEILYFLTMSPRYYNSAQQNYSVQVDGRP